MDEKGFGMKWFKDHNVFPILFREETIFLKEINGNEKITVDAVLVKMAEDGSRWTIMNSFFKEDGTLAAKLTVDGAWMDIVTRKLKAPPSELLDLFHKLTRTE